MSHPVDQHVGLKFKKARVLRSLSQTDVAKKVGLSFQQIQKYETGANRISASKLFEFARLLNVPPAFFFEGLEDADDAERAEDPNLSIVQAVAAIDDECVKARIITLIEDVSGRTVAYAS